MSRLTSLAPLALLLLLPFALGAADDHDEAAAWIAKQFPEVDIKSIKPSPIDGLYEVRVGNTLTYVTRDADSAAHVAGVAGLARAVDDGPIHNLEVVLHGGTVAIF